MNRENNRRSYMQLDPRRAPPKWVSREREKITTTDAEFDMVAVAPEENKEKPSGFLMVAWQRGNHWEQAKIHKKSIVRREVISV